MAELAPAVGMDWGEPLFGVIEMQPISWVVALAILTCFSLAMVMGANDVANAFGTSVGAGIVSIKVACIIAAIFEFTGAITLGAGVSDTIRKGIVDITVFEDKPELLALGNFCASIGAAGWVAISTIFSLPVSTTNAVVGAVVGYAMVQNGGGGVSWFGLGKIVASWLVSPIAAGCFASSIYMACYHLVLKHPTTESVERARKFVSFMMGLVVVMVIVFVMYDQTERGTMWDWLNAVIGLAAGVVGALVAYFAGIDIILKGIKENEATSTATTSAVDLTLDDDDEKKSGDAFSNAAVNLDEEKQTDNTPKPGTGRSARHDPATEKIFAAGQMVNAAYISFNHGANDIANVAGPLAGVVGIFTSGVAESKVSTPYWILALMGLGIVIGLYLFGAPVMRTLGENITYVSPSRGFSAEFGTASAVLIASFFHIPTSTTHAAVGAVMSVGVVGGDGGFKAINWKLFSGIAISWVVTLPVAGGISAGAYAAMRPFITAIYQ